MPAHCRLALVVVLLSLSGAIAEDKPDKLPQLTTRSLKVGANYLTDFGRGGGGNLPDRTNATILEIIDDDSMLVRIEQRLDNGSADSLVVLCKCKTKGFADGQKGRLATFLGTDRVTVSGTTKTGTKTVFVLEPLKDEKPKAKE